MLQGPGRLPADVMLEKYRLRSFALKGSGLESDFVLINPSF